jgi:omega-hydroxy-beta-dihydromenaquinone-9 sulfotransferase
MLFNFSLLFRVAYKALFKVRGTHARLTPKRVFSLLGISLFYGIAEITSWIGFFLDDIFFPGYRRQPVRQPVFIIGPPRSGTTFLQRLLARDEGRFSSMKSWEIMLAPSVTQKKIFAALGRLDRLCGSPLYRVVRAVETLIFGKFATFHPVSFFEAEEDSMILLHIFSSANAFFALPFTEELWPYFVFDQGLPAAQRRRIMGFYKRCVQNHLYAFGAGKIFLSKNPMFSTMIQSLDDVFPDARFIYLARTPFETVPSTISMLSFYFSTVMSPLEPCPYLNEQLELLSLYYTYPLLQFSNLPPHRRHIMLYIALVEHPAQAVTGLCTSFGLNMSPAYLQLLESNQGKAQRYTSNHVYSLEKTGLTRTALIEKYAAVFDRFGFEKNA